MNYWAIAIPCIMYFASFGMHRVRSELTLLTSTDIAGVVIGIMNWTWDLKTRNDISVPGLGTPYFSISLSLNILLTLMIIVRLILHHKHLRQAVGVTTRASRLYKAILVLLIESCALYTLSFLPYILIFVFHNLYKSIFWPILNGTQVRAVLVTYSVI